MEILLELSEVESLLRTALEKERGIKIPEGYRLVIRKNGRSGVSKVLFRQGDK